MGMSSMSARVSGILSPIILLLGNYWAPLPLLVFGISSILAGVFALLLPETKGRPLPETLEDGENIGGEFGFENIALENKTNIIYPNPIFTAKAYHLFLDP